jgi:hypothetical protein
VSASAEEGFLPSPGTATVLGGKSTLEIENKEGTGAEGKIRCEKLDDSTITFLSLEPDGHATGTLHWLECKAEGLFPAESKGAAKEEILVPVLLLVCLDPKSKAGKLLSEYGVLALVTGPGAGGAQDIEILTVGILVEVKGQALGALLTVKGKLFAVDFTGTAGLQDAAVECLVNGKPVKHNLLANMNKGVFKNASEEVVGGLVTFAKEVELMNK